MNPLVAFTNRWFPNQWPYKLWMVYIYVCPTVHNAVPRPQQKINHCTLLNVPVLHWHSIDSIILKKNNFHGTLETTCWKRAIDITMLKMFTLNPESFWNLIPVVIYRYMVTFLWQKFWKILLHFTTLNGKIKFKLSCKLHI